MFLFFAGKYFCPNPVTPNMPDLASVLLMALTIMLSCGQHYGTQAAGCWPAADSRRRDEHQQGRVAVNGETVEASSRN